MNSSKKYANFFSSGYYFPLYISPLSKIACQIWHDRPFSQKKKKATERTVGVGAGGDNE